MYTERIIKSNLYAVASGVRYLTIKYMTTQEKFNAIIKAYELKKVEDHREEIYIIADTCPEEVKSALLDMQQEIGQTFDLSYEIFAKACDVISEQSLEDLQKEDFDTIEAVGEQASVYTNVLLSYLNNLNEDEISEEVPIYKSIAMACAVWYDHQIELAVDEVREYIIKENND